MLHTLCNDCAHKICIFESLLPMLSERPCEGCGTTVGYAMGPADERGCRWPTHLVACYTHFWQHAAWPIMWGLSVQDTYGEHVHQWRAHHISFTTGECKETCRCGEKRTVWIEPSPPESGDVAVVSKGTVVRPTFGE